MNQGKNLEDVDRDSLHTVRLSLFPTQTPALHRAQLIKNSRLESVVELFKGVSTGSGQLAIDAVAKEFDWPGVDSHPDMVLLRKLAGLPSYDVYSLRILLRREDIPFNDIDEFRLSDDKRQELTQYMKEFTGPLIVQIYGGGDISIQDFDDVIALFRDPDVRTARDKLKTMARKLGIKLEQIPQFLEEYGDIFLSLAYYRQCLVAIEPVIEQFMETLAELRANFQLRTDTNLMNTCSAMETTFNGLSQAISGRFEIFDRSTNDMWNDVSADRFRQVETLIRSQHAALGALLCALTVKMDAWAESFPHADVGGPVRRAEFIMSQMRPGIEKMSAIERDSRLT